MDKKKKGILLTLIGLVGLIVITISITYAFFNYVKEGTTDNTITTSTITFLYTEIDKLGNGISIKDAYPISDSQGKMLSGTNEVFDFKITSTTPNTSSIPYEITARKNSESTLDESAVKLYLTKVVGNSEEEVLLSKYSDLTQTSKVTSDKHIEKTIYTGKVPANSKTYEQAFKLRMWVSSDTNFSPDENDNYPYNGKEFSITVNVYANAKVVTEEDLSSNNTEVSNITANGLELTMVDDENLGYKYEIDLMGVSTATISVTTKNPNSTVKIEEFNELVYNEENKVMKLSSSKSFKLLPGNNFLKVTVTSEDGSIEDSFVIKINSQSERITVEGNSIFQILNQDLVQGYYTFKVSDDDISVEYPIHLYVYNDDQIWDKNRFFGDSNDVGTATEYAKNMVIVKVNGNLSIQDGVNISPYYTEYGGPKGFTLYVTGTLTNNGTIDNSHGAYAEGEDVYLFKNSRGDYEFVPAIGASGGKYENNGSTGLNRQTGGGGGGGYSLAGSGSNGTSYSGGSGGGSGSYGNASPNGGLGGTAGSSGSSGAGNPAGICKVDNCIVGENGTGGLLTIYADSIINDNGNITANGSSGGNNNYGGGSSGGGSINIFYNKLLSKGIINCDGGLAFGSSTKGGKGGNGSISIGQILNGNYTKTDFEYTNSEEIFIVPITGKYRIEVWGAQGGSYDSEYYGGYGGYSSGIVELNANDNLYINVGGAGKYTTSSKSLGGYNGGGNGYANASGGGATHIATVSGILSELSSSLNQVLIVAAGGGGSCRNSSYSSYAIGGSGGGITGVLPTLTTDRKKVTMPTVATQETGGVFGIAYNNSYSGVNENYSNGKFGLGGTYSSSGSNTYVSGGGGGYYGGAAGYLTGATGGSGYIGNELLTEKIMYCYQCTESEDINTKTISTSKAFDKPISNYPKIGDGYARISYIEEK